MQIPSVVIVGAGGHGREILGILRAVKNSGANFDFLGFIDDEPPDSLVLDEINAQWLGTVDQFLESKPDSRFIVAVGNCEQRRQLATRFENQGLEALTLIHPSVTIGDHVSLAKGVVLFPGVVLTTNIKIGSHSHVNANSVISHDCQISKFVTISPNCSLTGGVTIGDSVLLGAHSTILPQISIGRGAIVGAGAVVVSDVSDFSTVIGVPAKPLVHRT